MAESDDDPYLETTIYDFKSKIARYIRLLEAGRYRAAVIKRYNEPVAFVIPYERLRVTAAPREAGEEGDI